MPKIRTFEFPATLSKAASTATGEWIVGGVASAFYRDLDGEAITPAAVREAIPAFMASRGKDGIQGGPLQLHHGFYDKFIRQAIDLLHLPRDEQYELVAAIALPLGRVSEIWVDDDGTTHWKGVLSQANPIARIIWQMLKENLLHIGVSLGGKILQTTPGRDRLGRPCTLISKIRLDEISLTSNPALRLTEGEDTGAYIAALSKSVRSALLNNQKSEVRTNSLRPKSMAKSASTGDAAKVDRFLSKALGGAMKASKLPTIEQSVKVWNATEDSATKTGMGKDLGEPKTKSPRGGKTIQMDGTQPKTGVGDKTPKAATPKHTGKEPPTDVYGMTVKEFTRKLGKCCQQMKKAEEWSSKDMLKTMTDGVFGLTTVAEDPPIELINFARFLNEFANYAQSLQFMHPFQAGPTVDAMRSDLTKALEEFEEKMPDELMEKPFRPPGSPGIGSLDIVLPQQYMTY